MDSKIIAIGISLALMDGSLNPCTLSVLTFLIAYLLAIASKKRCLMAAFSYISGTFLIYFLFMLGFLNLIIVSGFANLIKSLTALILLIIAIFNLLAAALGFQLKIRKTRGIVESLAKSATISSSFLLGSFVSLVEIPCAGGFPILYLNLIAGFKGISKIFLILLYNVFFILPSIVIALLLCFGLKKVEEVERKRKKLSKLMKLASNSVVILISILMLFGII